MSVRTLSPRRLIQGVLHPEAFHGKTERGPFFEGWYVKTQWEERTLVVIMGVFIGGDDPHAFLMVADTAAPRSYTHRFSLDQFTASDSRLDLRIGDNHLHERGLTLALDHDTWPLHGELHFGPLTPWPVSRRAPGCMGWFGWVPVMECYHGVISMEHSVTGQLEIAGETVRPTGRGYLETDWGRSFPRTWVWMHGFVDGASVMLSIARVPWMSGSFPGFLAAVRLPHGEIVRLAVWSGAWVEHVETTERSAHLILRDRTWRLEARGSIERAFELAGPSSQGMDLMVEECVAGPMWIRLSRKGQTVLEGQTAHGSVEVHGTAEQRIHLDTARWRREA